MPALPGQALRLALALLAATALGSFAPANAQPAKSSPRVDPGRILLRGAGATFPAPLYRKWIQEYGKIDPSVVIDYKDVGSGEGIKRFVDHDVDFGASDAALTDEQIARVKNGVVLVPATAGAVVLTYNLPGLNGPLKLSRSTYVDLLAGRIPKWTDARIQAINPGLKLPNKDVVLVVRQDGSGTTFALTNHLHAISEKWRRSAGAPSTLIPWSGNVMLARGNEGVAGRVKISEGSIGYVEYGFAKRLGMPMAHLENKAGNFVAPSADSSSAALAANMKSIPANLRAFLPDPDGEQSYPIVSLTWLLVYDRYDTPEKATALKRFITWALADGQAYGSDLGYVPLPGDLLARSKAAAGAIQ